METIPNIQRLQCRTNSLGGRPHRHGEGWWHQTKQANFRGGRSSRYGRHQCPANSRRCQALCGFGESEEISACPLDEAPGNIHTEGDDQAPILSATRPTPSIKLTQRSRTSVACCLLANQQDGRERVIKTCLGHFRTTSSSCGRRHRFRRPAPHGPP